ncbi:KAP family NTPase, partial [Francisellaceae bacterium]|nr:KAP family NTPase [Francisellaceae bacterium]
MKEENCNESESASVIRNIKLFVENRNDYTPPGYNESSNSMCFDGSWGSGKSFFIELIKESQEIKDLTNNILVLDAFKYDLFNDPILFFATNLIEELGGKEKSTIKAIIDFIRERISVSVNIPILLANIKVETKATDKGPIEEFNNFKSNIKTLLLSSSSSSDSKPSKPTLIIIDELDRCKPVFAVQVLEMIKHLFDIDDVIFIFSCDRKQLANAVQGIYGNTYNGLLYLDRFFSLIIPLVWDRSAKVAFTQQLFPANQDIYIRGNDIKPITVKVWTKFPCLTPRDIIHAKNSKNQRININETSYKIFETPIGFCCLLLQQTEKYGQNPLEKFYKKEQNLQKILEAYYEGGFCRNATDNGISNDFFKLEENQKNIEILTAIMDQ